MDGSRFDRLTIRLMAPGSRRRALGGLLTGALGLLSTQTEHAAAKKKPCPPCKKRKAGKCKKKKPDGTVCSGGTCQSGRCIPAPTCTDGLKNGTETDIDCGGGCPRCPSSKRCAGAADCASGFCLDATCQACSGSFLTSCGTDANGSCLCLSGVCSTNRSVQDGTSTTGNCGCPAGTTCFVNPIFPEFVSCHPPCG
jgi:hypothetical protein